ncbi:hypothetical protein [Flavobacterium columnare]|uniref:hypothetical protein n=1 Tax=Flavobacterium columnare TaxID=996 RepID=UPI00403451B9
MKLDKIKALGLTKNKNALENDESIPYYLQFLSYSGLDKLLDEYDDPSFLKKQNKADLLIFYVLGSKNELYIRITGYSASFYTRLSSDNTFEFKNIKGKMTYKDYVVNTILNLQKQAFLFNYNEILEALNNAIADYKFIISEQNTKQESNFTATSKILKSRVNLKEKGVVKLLQEVNRTIAKMRAEEKHTYNEWIISKADPYNYFGIIYNNEKNYTSKDLKLLIEQLQWYKTYLKDLTEGRVKNIEEMKNLVKKHLTAGGTKFKWFIDTPFFNLSKEHRLKYIEMYCTKDESAYPRFSVGDNLLNGDIVEALFRTCTNKQDLFDIIICLEQEGKLFHLLNNLKIGAFSKVCMTITSVYMTYIKKGEVSKKYAEAIKFGRQLLFDNHSFGNHNIEEFDVKNKKIKFTTELNVFLKYAKTTEAAPFLSKIREEDLQKPILCNPLDLVSFTPVEDIEKYELKGGEVYMLPACFVYLLYHEESWETAILAAEVTLQLAFCLIGVGEIMAAIEAGSTLGVAYAATGVTIDVAFGATLFKEFKKGHPILTEYIHYAMWVRLVADLINVRGIAKELQVRIKAKQINLEPYEATIDGVKFIKGTSKTYKPLSIKVLYVQFPETILALYTIKTGRKILFYIEKVIESAFSTTIFFKGAEIYSGSKKGAQEFMETALNVYKNEGQIAMENFFFAERASEKTRLLHSQTGETYLGKLARKYGNGEYHYELHKLDPSLHNQAEWVRFDMLNSKNNFRCDVKFADSRTYPLIENKKYFYADIFIPPNLNATLQANKTGLTDLSLGETIINDGFAALSKDAGKELDGIFGVWQKNSSYVDYPGGESVNLHTLKYEMLGKPITKENLEAAALKTFTGKWAKSKGYGKPELYNADNQIRELLKLGDIEKVNEIVFIFKQ